MVIHAENFVSIRTLHPRVAWRGSRRIEVGKPATSTELDYRDLLSEANECFFHREHAVALDKYLELRHKILVQSHPELPATRGLLDHLVLDATVIDPDRLIELSRRILIDVDPGDPVEVRADSRRFFTSAEVTPNPTLARFGNVRVDPGVANHAELDELRDGARRAVVDGDLKLAATLYGRRAELAEEAGEHRIAADAIAESGAVLATYAKDDRAAALEQAAASFDRAAALYHALGDVTARTTMQANLAQLRDGAPSGAGRGNGGGSGPLGRERSAVVTNLAVATPTGTIRLDDLAAGRVTLGDDLAVSTGRPGRTGTAAVRGLRLPEPATERAYLVPDGDLFKTSAAIVTSGAHAPAAERSVGVLTAAGPEVLALDTAQWHTKVRADLYESRLSATTLDQLHIAALVDTTFVAYIPHLFFYVLPIAIADTYAAMGRYQKAIEFYAGVLAYPYLNATIEGADLWRRMARTQLRWGDDLFRQGRRDEARTHYAQIVSLPAAVPTTSPLYGPGAFSTQRSQAGEVVKRLLGQPANAVNPVVSGLVTSAFRQLRKIDAGLNFLGLASDYAPVLRFTYLQAAANYLADCAVQAERTYVQFRSQAEQQKFDRIQLEGAVALNEAALDVERKRMEDAQLEVEAARRTRELTELRRANAAANAEDWDTIGREITSLNAALSWASNAANDQDISVKGIRYHGARHDYEGDVEDFYEQVGQVREWLNFDVQMNRLNRQANEAAAEVPIAEAREAQAQVRAEIQQLNIDLAEVRLEGAREVLDYAQERTFDEDLWFRLASQMQDLARSYLDMAIEAAYVMQRAYAVEHDRNLNRIRLDYGLGEPEGLLGGDHLKQDIASFTVDYIRNARKQNPVRAVVSLSEEFPLAFSRFQVDGLLPFRTDLELFDRRYPGTHRRKIKRVEVFVEGLVPPDGVRGTLTHEGIASEWRPVAGGWAKHHRVVPVESMVLSSYQLRRDVAVMAPPEELLALFENLGPQGNWVLHLPASANDLDYGSISDVKVVYYLDGDTDPGLAAHTRALYGSTGGRSFVRSARFHEPDEYFRLAVDRAIRFRVLDAELPRFVTDPQLTALGLRLVPAEGAAPLAGRTLTVTRGSDGTAVTVTTDAAGAVLAAPADLAPFDAWFHASPVDELTVAFAADEDLDAVLDVQLSMSYSFTYRADAVS